MFRAFFRVFGQDAFPVFMHFKHVTLGFLFIPSENLLENVGDIIHEVDRVIPANHHIAGLAGITGFCVLDRVGNGMGVRCRLHTL